jgi:hypothetical protein
MLRTNGVPLDPETVGGQQSAQPDAGGLGKDPRHTN